MRRLRLSDASVFTLLRLLAKRVGVLGMRDPIPGAQ